MEAINMNESGGLGLSRKIKWYRVMHAKLKHEEDLVLKAKREEEKAKGPKKKVKKVLTAE